MRALGFAAVLVSLGTAAEAQTATVRQKADDHVVVNKLTVDERIADLYLRLRQSTAGKSIIAREQAEAGIASSVLFYTNGEDDVPIWVLGLEPGTYASKGDMVFAYTCARIGIGKNDFSVTTIREAVEGADIQKRCTDPVGPARYEYKTLYWTELMVEMYPGDAAKQAWFAERINYRPYVKDVNEKIERRARTFDDVDALIYPDHGSAAFRTTGRAAWTY